MYVVCILYVKSDVETKNLLQGLCIEAYTILLFKFW